MISYDPLFDTMKKKGLNQTDLLTRAGFPRATFNAIKHGKYTTLHTIETLCSFLGCGIEDVVKIIPDDDWKEIKPGRRKNQPKDKSDKKDR